ncbi:hypothetical protein ABN763_11120 [Spongiivirga sp. MCCC 1A20706]|uniref:hypothetical protein n=1 Tax=Spongiivirga sp. MCCC 1A20706 TaxID=3160963 RepID=UPI003977ADF2
MSYFLKVHEFDRIKSKLFIALIVVIGISCKTSYYFSPNVIGKVVDHEDQPIEQVSIYFTDKSEMVKTEIDGDFYIKPKKITTSKKLNLSEQRMINSSFIIFYKKGYSPDTIDINNYDYDKSVFAADTLDLGKIILSKMKL